MYAQVIDTDKWSVLHYAGWKFQPEVYSYIALYEEEAGTARDNHRYGNNRSMGVLVVF